MPSWGAMDRLGDGPISDGAFAGDISLLYCRYRPIDGLRAEELHIGILLLLVLFVAIGGR